MIPPNILLITCLTTFVYSQQYDLAAETFVPSNEKELKVTEESFHYFGKHFNKQVTNSLHNNKETTQEPLLLQDYAERNFVVEKELTSKPVPNTIPPPSTPPLVELPDNFNETADFVVETSGEDDTSYITLDDMSSTGTEYRVPVTNIYTLASLPSSSDKMATNDDGNTQIYTRSGNIPTSTITTKTPTTTTATSIQATVEPPLMTTRHATKSTATPRIKMGKTIKTYKSSADQVLRQFVENGYLRQPIACIIDTTESNLRKAQMLWNATLRSNAPLDILLSGYNSTGVGGIFSFKNTRTLLTGLSSMRESTHTDESGKAFNAILKASELIPYDSAIFLSTDNDPTDFEQFDRAATVLIKKRIRLYLIWFGENTFEENETSERQGKTGGKLGELSLSTGGEILHITNDALDKNGDLGLITLFARTGIQESLDFDIPIQESVTIQPIYTTRAIQSSPVLDPEPEFIVNGD